MELLVGPGGWETRGLVEGEKIQLQVIMSKAVG